MAVENNISTIAYDKNSIITDDIIISGNKFKSSGIFSLISNKAIPKDSNSYIEVVINSYSGNKDIRHLPIYLGLHKEPLNGILETDHSIGSIYYMKDSSRVLSTTGAYINFTIKEKQGYSLPITRYANSITARVPLLKTIIGIGIDTWNNRLTLFSDGKELYSWQCIFDTMDLNTNYYFFLHSNEVSTKNIEGEINYGKYNTVYSPSNYSSLYSLLYGRKESSTEIFFEMKTGYRFSEKSFDQDIIEGKCTIDNQLAPVNESGRDIDIIVSDDNMNFYINSEIINHHAFNIQYTEDNYYKHQLAMISYPLDHYKKLYFEFYCANIQMNHNIIGIPLSLVFSKSKENITDYSFKIDLFRNHNENYKITTTISGFELIDTYNMLNPAYPMQPNRIGVIIDLANNNIQIYTKGGLFANISSNPNLINFTNSTEPVYMFFEARSDVFTGEGFVICNFGNTDDHSSDVTGYYDEPLTYKYLCDNETVYSLWHYYNYTIREMIDIDFFMTIKTISDKLNYSKIIYCQITVPENNIESKDWSPGLNKLYNTYNTISNTEEQHNIPDISIFDLQKMIKEDNNKRE